MANCVEDLALLLSVMAGHDRKDSTSNKRGTEDFCRHLNKSIKNKVIGIPKEYFSNDLNPEIPTIIVFAYYSCPKMCSFTLQGVEDVVVGSEKFRPGKDYNLVTISIDESETSQSVFKYEQKYCLLYTSPSPRD